MGKLSVDTISALQELIVKRANSTQGGLFTGVDPTAYNTSDPLRLWIIQVGIIIIMAQILGFFLGKIKQPRVIAEILGGILLGPTALGRIPGFTNHIFPANSIPFLSLTANIGLCLFLFIIGLEIDPSIIRRNARLSVIVSLAGVILPFGIGCGFSVALYHQFIGSTVKFHYFMLFIGVSYSITAFPVLCRILSALKLLETTVGLIALSAGVANDVIGWSLLALAIAFVNATSGINALWVFLTCVAYTLFLLFPVKWALAWLARKTGSTIHGPSLLYMTIVILVLWVSAFFTDIVGVNAIFGAFVVGVIVPREGGISIAFVEKLEDMVQIIFLPIYFTTSGLNTNLGLLNTGKIWGFVFASATLDFTGKFIGCMLPSRALGFSWREATAVGSLMSCKGLVELIVLNIGLNAGILTRQVFSMFVLEALILTFMTTPLVNLVYPPKYRTRGLGSGIDRGMIRRDDIEREKSGKESYEISSEDDVWRTRFAVVLDEFQHMPAVMALTKLLLPPIMSDDPASVPKSNTTVNALRLIQLSDRTSTWIKSAMTESLIRSDPLVGVFKLFGEQSDMPISASLSVVPQSDWSHAVADHAQRHASQLVLLPWIPPVSFGTAAAAAADHSFLAEGATGSSQHKAEHVHINPFDTFFGLSSRDPSASTLQSHFVRGVFRHSKTDVAVYVDVLGGDNMNDRVGTNHEQHVLLPFWGGADDRLALELVVQLCANLKTSATVVRVVGKADGSGGIAKPELAVIDEGGAEAATPAAVRSSVTLSLPFPNTVYGPPNSTYLLQSDTADELIWARYASAAAAAAGGAASASASSFAEHEKGQPTTTLPHPVRTALSRIEFVELSAASDPLVMHTLLERARQLKGAVDDDDDGGGGGGGGRRRRLLVLAGRSKRFGRPGVRREVKQLVEECKLVNHEMVRDTIGDVATAFVAGGPGVGVDGVVVVVQQAGGRDDHAGLPRGEVQ